MDKIGGKCLKVVGQIQTRLGANPVRVQLASGAEEDCADVVDPLNIKAIDWNEADQ